MNGRDPTTKTKDCPSVISKRWIRCRRPFAVVPSFLPSFLPSFVPSFAFFPSFVRSFVRFFAFRPSVGPSLVPFLGIVPFRPCALCAAAAAACGPASSWLSFSFPSTHSLTHSLMHAWYEWSQCGPDRPLVVVYGERNNLAQLPSLPVSFFRPAGQ